MSTVQLEVTKSSQKGGMVNEKDWTEDYLYSKKHRREQSEFEGQVFCTVFEIGNNPFPLYYSAKFIILGTHPRQCSLRRRLSMNN